MTDNQKWEIIKRLLDGLSNRLRSQWEEYRRQRVSSDAKGDSYENSLADFLKEYLGGTYDFHTKAAIIDEKLECFNLFSSKQNEFDVVAKFSQCKPQFIFKLEDMEWIPYNGVAFICEVKSSLNSTNLKDDLEKTGKLSEIEREEMRGVTIEGDMTVDHQLKCLVYDDSISITKETIFETLENNMDSWDLILLVDMDELIVNPKLPFSSKVRNSIHCLKTRASDIILLPNGLIWFLTFLSVSIPHPPSLTVVNPILNMVQKESKHSLLLSLLDDESKKDYLKENLGILGDIEDPHKYYSKPRKLDIKSPGIYTETGVFLVKHGKLDQAEKYYREALEMDPEELVVCLNLSELQIKMEDYKEGYDLSQKALDLTEELDGEAISLMLLSISKEMLNKDYSEELERLEEVCGKDFEVTWDFEELDTWLEDADLSDEKEENIKEIMNLVRPHTSD
ncbi:MAG: DUF6602 domain-containing protein [Promethearchaeia archaeon]